MSRGAQDEGLNRLHLTCAVSDLVEDLALLGMEEIFGDDAVVPQADKLLQPRAPIDFASQR